MILINQPTVLCKSPIWISFMHMPLLQINYERHICLIKYIHIKWAIFIYLHLSMQLEIHILFVGLLWGVMFIERCWRINCDKNVITVTLHDLSLMYLQLIRCKYTRSDDNRCWIVLMKYWILKLFCIFQSFTFQNLLQ